MAPRPTRAPSSSAPPTSPRTCCSPRSTPARSRPRASRSTSKLNIGSRETYIPALKDGSIDLIPEYTGVLAQYFNKDAKATDADGVYKELKAALPPTLTVLDKSAAEDKDAVVVTKETADKYKLKSIADLQPVAKDLTLGGPPEWKTRPTGVPGLKKIYGLTSRTFRPLDAGGPLTVHALRTARCRRPTCSPPTRRSPPTASSCCTTPRTSSPRRTSCRWSPRPRSTTRSTAALNAVSAKLDTTTLAELVKEVVTDKKDASAVAKEFLAKNNLG